VWELKFRCKKLESLYSSRSLESVISVGGRRDPLIQLCTPVTCAEMLRPAVKCQVNSTEAKAILRVILDAESSSEN